MDSVFGVAQRLDVAVQFGVVGLIAARQNHEEKVHSCFRGAGEHRLDFGVGLRPNPHRPARHRLLRNGDAVLDQRVRELLDSVVQVFVEAQMAVVEAQPRPSRGQYTSFVELYALHVPASKPGFDHFVALVEDFWLGQNASVDGYQTVADFQAILCEEGVGLRSEARSVEALIHNRLGILGGSANREADHIAGLVTAQLGRGILAGQDDADLGRQIGWILAVSDIDDGVVVVCVNIVRVLEEIVDTDVSALAGVGGLRASRCGFFAALAFALLGRGGGIETWGRRGGGCGGRGLGLEPELDILGTGGVLSDLGRVGEFTAVGLWVSQGVDGLDARHLLAFLVLLHLQVGGPDSNALEELLQVTIANQY